MKVAINASYGGFGLSDEAFEALLNLKGVQYDKCTSRYSIVGQEYYKAGHTGENDYYISQHDFCMDRADPDLIKVIEQFDKSASNRYSRIVIIDIPDDVEWHISEYDGLEHIAENHRTWYASD